MTEKEFKVHLKWVTDGSIVPISYYNGKYKQISCRCIECGREWLTTPNHLLDRKQGCASCNRRKAWKNRKTKQSAVERVHKIFPQYDLPKIDEGIKTQKDKISVTCPKHGEFVTTLDSLLHHHECPKCSYEKRGTTKSVRREDFIANSIKAHGNKYDYSKVPNKIKSDEKVPIICKVHGEFFQTPYHHANRKQGCPLCNESSLEFEIESILMHRKIQYESQKHFSWLGLKTLDFYIPTLRIAIECQGVQHYEPIEFFGGVMAFGLQSERDVEKKTLCEENGITLLYYTHYHDRSKYSARTFNDASKLFNYINTIKNESFIDEHLEGHPKRGGDG